MIRSRVEYFIYLMRLQKQLPATKSEIYMQGKTCTHPTPPHWQHSISFSSLINTRALSCAITETIPHSASSESYQTIHFLRRFSSSYPYENHHQNENGLHDHFHRLPQQVEIIPNRSLQAGHPIAIPIQKFPTTRSPARSEQFHRFFPSEHIHQIVQRQWTAGSHQRLFSTQSRVFTQIDSSPRPLEEKKRPYFLKTIALVLGFIGAGWLFTKGQNSRLEIQQPQEDPPQVKEMHKFVQQFNEAKKKPLIDPEPLFKQALQKIDALRLIGKLAPRTPLSANVNNAKLGLLVLTTCDDFAIQYEAFKHLKILLKENIEATISISDLLFFESKLGEILEKGSEVNDPVLILQEQVACYRLVLEQIFFYLQLTGAKIGKSTKIELVQRIRHISEKLERNPAFQYEALNARTIAHYLETPSPLVTETLSAISDVASIYVDCQGEIQSILLESLSTLEDLKKLEELLRSKSMKQYKKVEQVFLRLQENWISVQADLTVLESILFLKPQWNSQFQTEKNLSSLQEAIKTIVVQLDVKQGLQDEILMKEIRWVSLYRIVEILSEIVLSHAEESLREEAFQELVSLTDSKIPWQVRYKIITFLWHLKKTAFQDLAERQISVFLSSPYLEAEMKRALLWFERVQKAEQEADNAIIRQSSFVPSGALKNKLELLNEEWMIPRRAPLTTIMSQFQISTDDFPRQIIHGFRGNGKTTLAADYVRFYGKDYTRVFWMDAKTIPADLSTIADDVGVSSDFKPRDRWLKLKEWLEDKENQGWLLVIDDLEPDTFKEVKELLPYSGGHLLATTYHESTCNRRDFPLKVSLPSFSPLEATSFLLQSFSLNERDRNAALSIAEKLGYLPLALRHAKAYVDKVGISLDDYLRRFERYKIKLLDSENSIVATWEMNFEEVKKRAPLVQELLPLLACLYAHHIPSTLLETWLQFFQSETTVPALDKALAELKEFSLIEGRNGVYRIHPFLQEIIQENLGEEERKRFLRQTLIILHRLMTKTDSYDHHQWQAINNLIPHCHKILENEIAQEDVLFAAAIQEELGHYYSTQSDFTLAQKEHEKALSTYRAVYTSGEHLSIARCCINLGMVLKDQVDLQGAKEHLEEAERIYRKIYPDDDHFDVASCRLNLGIILLNQANFHEAKEKFEGAEKIYRNIDSEDKNLGIALCSNSLASILFYQNDLEGAQKKYEEALSMYLIIHGTDEHVNVAMCLNNLGNILLYRDDLKGAKEKYEATLRIYRKIYQTEEHSDIAGCLLNLSAVLFAQDDTRGAKETCEKALSLFRKIHQQKGVAGCLNLLGTILQDTGDIQGAKKNYEEALRILRQIHGSDEHPHIIECLDNLNSLA